MENFLATLALLMLGILLRKLRLFPKDSAQTLNLFVIYVSLPALILVQIPKLSFSTDIIVPIIMPWGMLIVSALLVLLASRLLQWKKEVTGALLLIVPLGNTSFLGIPMVKAFWGTENISYAVLYDQLGSFMALSTYGTLILATYGDTDKPAVVAIARKIFLFPPFLALISAFILKPFLIPESLTAMLEIIAASLVPVVMVAVGMQLKLRMTHEEIAPFSFGLLIKLVIAPLMAFSFCKIIGLDTMAAKVSIFEAGMPPMVTAGALALMAGLAPELTAAMVGYGILFSFLTLPALYQLF
jgi:hypothetical protein